MKPLDIYSYTGITEQDNKAIMKHIEQEIDLFIDEYGRVFNEGGQYVADAKEEESGAGIGCKN